MNDDQPMIACQVTKDIPSASGDSNNLKQSKKGNQRKAISGGKLEESSDKLKERVVKVPTDNPSPIGDTVGKTTSGDKLQKDVEVTEEIPDPINDRNRASRDKLPKRVVEVVSRNYSLDDCTDEDIDYDDEVRDKDYVPCSSDETDEDESDDSRMSDTFPAIKMLTDVINNNPSKIGGSKTASDKLKDGVEGTERITVPLAKRGEKRIWDKKHACLYCCDLQSNLRRHLFRKHENELEVAKVMSYAKKSEARKKGLEKLQNLGDFYHNAKVIEKGEGDFLVTKRPSSDKIVSYKEYVPCVFCKGYFLGVEIWRHYKDCKFKSEDLTVDNEECRTYINAGNLRGSRILAENACKGVKGDVEQLFGSMRNDDITFVSKHDDMISRLGLKLYETKGPRHVEYIRAKMREIARLLIRIREQTQIKDQTSNSAELLTLKEALKPERFDDVIKGVLGECKYSVENGTPSFEIPSLALKLGHTLRKCCYIKMGLSVRAHDEKGEHDAEKFIKLLTMEFTGHVSSIALQTLNCVKRKKPQCLPVTKDIVKFQTFIKEKVITLTKQLQEKKNGQDYCQLVKAALARMITFNKRRSGETAKILISDYMERQRGNSHQNQDIYEMLTETEQKLASRLELMNIPGKRGRTVPIILTLDIIDAMDILCDQNYREKAGVSKDNRFAFPMIRGSGNNVRGCDALNDMVIEADLSEPKAFKSTGLRKYIATVSQVLNMDENEMDWLASHLGHDIRVHRQFYRLQTEHVELAKVAKLLHAVDSGQAHSFAGKKLNDIQIDDFDDYENIDDEDEECDEMPSNGEENCEEVSLIGEEDQQQDDVIESNELQKRSSGSKNKKGNEKKGKQCIHIPWSKEEKEFVMREFHRFIIKGQIAGVGKKRVDEAISKSGDILKNRTWVQVKSCLKNIIVKIQKEKSWRELK